jgi:MGT family glycosyltransferase
MAIARQLQARGHSVAFYTGSRAHALIRGQGFGCFPLGRILEERQEELFSPGGVAQGWWRRPWQPASPGKVLSFLQSLLIDTIPPQMADLDAILNDWKPNAILCEPAMWAPRLILHRTRQIPVALLEFSFAEIPGPDVAFPGLGLPPPRTAAARCQARLHSFVMDLLMLRMRRAVSRMRQYYGVPPLESSVLAAVSELPLVIVPSCPEYDYDRHDLPATVEYVGLCAWYPPASEPLDWLDELPDGRPWVHVSEGTCYTQSPVILRAAAQGLAELPVEVIMTTGTQRGSEGLDLGKLAPNTVVRSWIPHSALLPRTAVNVTHGGGGTVIASLAAGVPMVLVPLMWDQPENAQRVVHAGAGVLLPLRSCSPQRLRRTVLTVLENPSYRRRAKQMAMHLSRYGGPGRAANLLERLAA